MNNKNVVMIIGFLVVLLSGLLVISIAYHSGGKEKMRMEKNGSMQETTFRKGKIKNYRKIEESDVSAQVTVGGDALVKTTVEVQ